MNYHRTAVVKIFPCPLETCAHAFLDLATFGKATQRQKSQANIKNFKMNHPKSASGFEAWALTEVWDHEMADQLREIPGTDEDNKIEEPSTPDQSYDYDYDYTQSY